MLSVCEEEVRHADLSRMTAALEKDVHALAPTLYNSFGEVIFPIHEGADKVRRALEESGALRVLLSGSGPSVFALYETEEAAQAGYDALRAIGADRFITRPVRRCDEE